MALADLHRRVRQSCGGDLGLVAQIISLHEASLHHFQRMRPAMVRLMQIMPIGWNDLLELHKITP